MRTTEMAFIARVPFQLRRPTKPRLVLPRRPHAI
jgi:hypothetical protein